eukprot:31520-Pelagococcus_subviridis.AAC.9
MSAGSSGSHSSGKGGDGGRSGAALDDADADSSAAAASVVVLRRGGGGDDDARGRRRDETRGATTRFDDGAQSRARCAHRDAAKLTEADAMPSVADSAARSDGWKVRIIVQYEVF